MKRKITLLITFALTALISGGCVERLIKITTKPSGALVWINDKEVGASPVTVDFIWYGEYEVVIRKEGYDTIKTSRRTPRPLYQWPGIDFFAETLWPGTLTDRHEWDYDLTPTEPTDTKALAERAAALRKEALEQP